MRQSPTRNPQSGFVTMIVVLLLIIAAVIFLAFKRVVNMQ